MLFNSAKFAIFFPIVTALYFLAPHRLRWALLLAASCLFYMAFVPAYILILLVTILIDYWAAIYIERLSGRPRKWLLQLSIVSTCLVLFIFKYIGFFNANVEAIAKLIGWNYSPVVLGLILPIGLSFHTFQSLSYVIEVYRGHQKAERHFGIYALYVMFYPQLVAGPIERPQNLLHQFHEVKSFDQIKFASGLRLMLWGLFKKVVIADRLAIYVNGIYSNPSAFSGPDLALATVAFAYQIYCDFSGYSDMAIGAARVMGFDLMKNFDAPYHSRSISEFWKRWHISLSTWFKDYLYVPMGGSRTTLWRVYRNLLVTFIVSGLWHGASWNYVVWGGLNGLYLVFGQASADLRKSIRAWIQSFAGATVSRAVSVSATFALTCLAWVFFRSNNLSDAWVVISSLGRGWSAGLTMVDGFSLFDGVAAAIALLVLEGVQIWQSIAKNRGEGLSVPVYFRWPAYYAMAAAILVCGVFEGTQFIYFQF